MGRGRGRRKNGKDRRGEEKGGVTEGEVEEKRWKVVDCCPQPLNPGYATDVDLLVTGPHHKVSTSTVGLAQPHRDATDYWAYQK